ncbi:MAG: hypothetical protein EPO10_30230 [Reyranella sp.]|nr:MAG: hypothetical protein EPO41_25875 [Reyranella sp.]TBR21231.1 MAG: hypothetical protein EPO10_30230 [Reyranella sp.]
MGFPAGHISRPVEGQGRGLGVYGRSTGGQNAERGQYGKRPACHAASSRLSSCCRWPCHRYSRPHRRSGRRPRPVRSCRRRPCRCRCPGPLRLLRPFGRATCFRTGRSRKSGLPRQ